MKKSSNKAWKSKREPRIVDPPVVRTSPVSGAADPVDLPNIVIVGHTDAAMDIAQIFLPFEVDLIRAEDTDRSFQKINEMTSAILWVDPESHLDVAEICRMYGETQSTSHTPLMVVVPDGMSPKRERDLYESGVTVVFEWPRSRSHLPYTVLTLLAMGVKPMPDSTGASLQHAVEIFLNANEFMTGCRIHVMEQDGFILLLGVVDALWKVHVAQSLVAMVPGVNSVDASFVEVAERQSIDVEIEDAAFDILRRCVHEMHSVDVTASSGCVGLSGTVGSHEEIDTAVPLIRDLAGVKQVENRIVVSPETFRFSKKLAGLIEQSVRRQYAEGANGVDVAACGGSIVLRGKFPGYSDYAYLYEMLKRLARSRLPVVKVSTA